MATRELYLSPRWKGNLGDEDHELANCYETWERLIHSDDLKRARAQLQSYLTGQRQTYQLEHRLRHKDGSYRWILAGEAASRDANRNSEEFRQEFVLKVKGLLEDCIHER